MLAARAASRAAAPAVRVAAVSSSRVSPAAGPTRGMMMMAGPKPEYKGVEKIVRHYLPEDKHIVVGVVGAYVAGYYVIKIGGKIFSSAKKAPAAAPPVSAPSASSGEIPEGDAFYEWVDVPENLEKFLAALDK